MSHPSSRHRQRHLRPPSPCPPVDGSGAASIIRCRNGEAMPTTTGQNKELNGSGRGVIGKSCCCFQLVVLLLVSVERWQRRRGVWLGCWPAWTSGVAPWSVRPSVGQSVGGLVGLVAVWGCGRVWLLRINQRIHRRMRVLRGRAKAWAGRCLASAAWPWLRAKTLRLLLPLLCCCCFYSPRAACLCRSLCSPAWPRQALSSFEGTFAAHLLPRLPSCWTRRVQVPALFSSLSLFLFLNAPTPHIHLRHSFSPSPLGPESTRQQQLALQMSPFLTCPSHDDAT